jgi:hypothetical protein
MESKSENYKISYHQIFEAEFETVFMILKNWKITNKLCRDIIDNYSTDPLFIKGNCTYEVGNEWAFIWKGICKIYWKCCEVYKDDNYAHIKWLAYKTEPVNIPYYFNYYLRRNTLSNNCIFTLETIFLYSNLRLSEKEEKDAMDEREIIYSGLDLLIRNIEIPTEQIESITIKSDINTINQMILNLKYFQKLVPEICDKVEYTGTFLKKGDTLKFHWFRKIKMVVDILITDVQVEDNKTIFAYECSDNKNMVPQQDVQWEIIKISDNNCFIIFRHMFKKHIKTQSLSQISEKKRKILMDLKIGIENGIYKSYL